MYVVNDNVVKISQHNFKTQDKLPVGNYLLEQDPMTGEFYLIKTEPFRMPDKVYGDVDGLVNRYLNTFKNRTKNLGIMLTGLKGTGKSLTAKKLCIDSNLPVILVTTPYTGTGFESFLASIKDECIVFIDEFEKVFTSQDGRRGVRDSQTALLTILDGVFESKKMFLMTSNYADMINDALKNRPSRIHYLKSYSGLSDAVIEDVIDDLLVNKSNKQNLIHELIVMGDVNMDALVSIINEMNLYDETATEALSYLNIKPSSTKYEVTFESEEQNKQGNVEKAKFTSRIHVNPLSPNGNRVYMEATPESNNHYYLEREIDYVKDDVEVVKIDRKEIVIKAKGTLYKFAKIQPVTIQSLVF